MTVSLRLEDEFYTEQELAKLFNLPEFQLIGMRGTSCWPPYSYVNGQFFYRKSLADYYKQGYEQTYHQCVMYLDEAGPSIPIDELDDSPHSLITGDVGDD